MTSPTFSSNEIAGLIYLVGGWGPNKDKPLSEAGKAKVVAWLDTAIAVALAESGGNSGATSPTADYGIWQINKASHTVVVETYTLQYGKSLWHPLVNTSVARDIQTGQGWEPWSTYKSGAYKSHLGHGAEAFTWMHQKDNIKTLKQRIATTDDFLWTLNDSQFNVKTAENSSWQDILKGFPDYFTGLIKGAGIATGVFVLGALLLILGIVLMVSRSSFVRSAALGKVAGPAGVVADAAKGFGSKIGKPEVRK